MQGPVAYRDCDSTLDCDLSLEPFTHFLKVKHVAAGSESFRLAKNILFDVRNSRSRASNMQSCARRPIPLKGSLSPELPLAWVIPSVNAVYARLLEHHIWISPLNQNHKVLHPYV